MTAARLRQRASDAGQPWTVLVELLHLHSDVKNVALLQAAHIDCTSLAHNHTLDTLDVSVSKR